MKFESDQPESTDPESPGRGSMEGWSPQDFEAAVPLFVGGDLEPGDVKRLEEWLEAHPEDLRTVDAAKASLEVLARHRARLHLRETPDLWAGVRRELQSTGLLTPDPVSGSPAEKDFVTSEVVLAPILGGARWFQRTSVAAAAALLLTGSMGAALMLRAPASGSEAVAAPIAHLTSDQPSARVPDSGSIAAVAGSAGSPVDVRAAGLSRSPASADVAGTAAPEPSRVAGRVQPLRRMQPGAQRLIDEAPSFLLWQVDPALSGAQPTGAAQLTGGK